MDQCGALTEEITQANHDALDCDGWEIDAHPACAPTTPPYRGGSLQMPNTKCWKTACSAALGI
jgi:hypothetical protein